MYSSLVKYHFIFQTYPIAVRDREAASDDLVNV